MNTIRHTLQNRRGAFTLIELLVVIAVIAILAGLILATAGIGSSTGRKKRVEAERDALITAIQRFKQDKGYYPPDNPNSTVLSPLFYELTGMVATLNPANGSPVSFKSPVTAEVFQQTDLPGLFGIQGFVNSSADPTQVRNYFDKISIGGRTWTFPSGVATSPSYTLFGIGVKGPPAEEMHATNGAIISPFNYKSTNPANNPDSYDLWIDVTYGGGGKNNRISNWSKDPQPF